MLDMPLIAQPEAPLLKAVVTPSSSSPPPPTLAPTSCVTPTDSSTPIVASGVVCMLNYQWSLHHDVLDREQKEQNGGPWRVPRAMPGIAHRKKKKNKKGKVIQKDVLSYKKVVNHFRLQEKTNDGKWRCKKNDGKKWQCKRVTFERNTLCKYHLCRKSSSVQSKEEAPVANVKSATVETLVTSNSDRVRASANLKLAPMNTSTRSKANPTSVASGSKAASLAIKLSSSRQPRKKKKVDNDLSEPFLYYDLYTPFRTKRRGNYSSNNDIMEAVANFEETKHPQVVTGAEGSQGQDHAVDEAPDRDNIDEIIEDDEEGDEDYCAPRIGNNNPRVKNGRRKVFLPDFNGPKVGMKHYKSVMSF